MKDFIASICCFLVLTMNLNAEIPKSERPSSKVITDTKRASRPVYPLYALVFGNVPNPQKSDLEFIARNFIFVTGHKWKTEEIEYAKSFNPDVQFIAYVGAWSVGLDGGNTERNLRREILYYIVANLGEAIDAKQTEFQLTPLKEGQSVALKESTMEGKYSSVDPDKRSVDHYVTWIRIGNELMKIERWDPETGKIKVMRDLDDHGSTKHEKGAKVFCPAYGVYPGYKHYKNKQLSYHYDPEGKAKWRNEIWSRLVEVTELGMDGIWIDVLEANSLGVHTINGAGTGTWNFNENRPTSPVDFRKGNEIGLNFIQNEFKKKYGRWPILYGNRLDSGQFLTPHKGVTIRYLIPTDIKPRPVDGMSTENTFGRYGVPEWDAWATKRRSCPPIKGAGKAWEWGLGFFMQLAQMDLPVLPLIINGGMKTVILENIPVEQRHEFETWAFANFLMGVEVDKDGNCKSRLGTVLFHQEGNRRYAYLDECYRWPIGVPLETQKWPELEGYKIPDRTTHQRRFSNGLVLVNPEYKEDKEIELDQTYIDPETGKKIHTIIMPPATGKILLKKYKK